MNNKEGTLVATYKDFDAGSGRKFNVSVYVVKREKPESGLIEQGLLRMLLDEGLITQDEFSRAVELLHTEYYKP